MKLRILLLLMIALMAHWRVSADDRFDKEYQSLMYFELDRMGNEKEFVNQLQAYISRSQEAAGKSVASLPGGFAMLEERSAIWTDGFALYESLYFDEDRTLKFANKGPNFFNIHAGGFALKKGKKGWTDQADGKYGATLQVMGPDTVLVVNNAQGKVRNVLYKVARENINSSFVTMHRYNLIHAGVYTGSDGEASYVFGPSFPWYKQIKESYMTDPGIFLALMRGNRLLISYGGGRVSRGNPNASNYGKMPGGGGAGAIMNAMLWDILGVPQGLDVTLERDEPYVDHLPALNGKHDVLTKVEDVYPELDGKWGFASAIALTPQLLQTFSAEALKLMRAEIYARHGDTFRDAATQRYFDAQPWYKKKGAKVTLTDIERFNYRLIKQVEQNRR